MNLAYSELLDAAEKRYRFHEDVKSGKDVAAAAAEHGVVVEGPARKDVVAADHVAYYAYMMASLRSHETKVQFAENEAALFLQRLQISRVPVKAIPRYFWCDLEARDRVLEVWDEARDVGMMEFESAFELFDAQKMEMVDGRAVVRSKDVYRFCAKMFQTKVMGHIQRQTKSIARNCTVVDALVNDFAKRIEPVEEPLVTLETLDQAQQRSFPPCMYRIYDSLKKSGMLAFKGQFELSLFLKGLGLSEQQQEEFWKCSKKPESVNIKTIYGLDEQGKDYCPHSCVTMATRERPKSVYQVQGCPFRYMARSEMKMYLKKIGRGSAKTDIEDILGKMPTQPQIACRMFFDSVFPNSPFPDTAMSHPVEFFKESEKRIRKSK